MGQASRVQQDILQHDAGLEHRGRPGLRIHEGDRVQAGNRVPAVAGKRLLPGTILIFFQTVPGTILQNVRDVPLRSECHPWPGWVVL